jgi:hypothetical protein
MESKRLPSETMRNDAGVGGGLRYLSETPSSRMVNQEHRFSCVIACTRQLLGDAGEEFSEAGLIEGIGVREGFGSELEPAAAVLSELHPRLIYLAGSMDPDAVHELFRRDPWIARVKTLGGRYHTIIVDGLFEDVLSVRDPWGLTGPGAGSGSEATIRLDIFLEHWQFGIHEAIVSIGLKAGSGA